MNGNAALAVVIPFFNEDRSVEAVCRELQTILDCSFPSAEVILVNDGSSDKTAARLEEIGAGWSQAQVFHLAENQGQSAALLFGFAKTTAPIIVTMDGDGQNDPNDIKRLLPRLEEADMVVGVRINRQDSWMRRKISWVANVVRSALLGDGVSDAGCALKAFRREVVNSFIPIRTLYSFMPALAVAAGFRVVEEPVRHRPRHDGISKYTVRSFLVLPIIDFVGLKWFGVRRCRAQSTRWPNDKRISLGNEIHRRGFQVRMKMTSLILLGAAALIIIFAHQTRSVSTYDKRIDLHRAEAIALSQVPKGQLGVEECRTENNRLTWAIDVHVPHSTDLREIDIDALSSRIIATRTETAAEEAQEMATDDHQPSKRSFGPP